jgi:hypothetical protein
MVDGESAPTLPLALASIAELARAHAATAIAALAEIAAKGASDAARVSAANALLDRGYGRTGQAAATGSAEDELVDISALACLSDEELLQLEALAEKISAADHGSL